MPESQKQELLIRFRGICAHLERPNYDDKTKRSMRKRTVLIRHRDDSLGIEHHIPYLEFYPDDLESVSSPQLKVVQYSRPGSDGRLARIEFDNPVEIRMKDLLPGDVEESLSFRNDLTHMDQILGKKAPVSPALLVPEARNIDSNRVAAVFDMPAGRVVAGEPEAMITRFPADVPFKPRRLPRWTDLYTEYTGPLVVELTRLGSDNETYEVAFKSSLRMLTIGNEPERLILGVMQPGHGEAASGHGVNHGTHDDPDAAPIQPTGHFILYYDLLENPPAREFRPLPIPSQINGPGCPNHVYP